MDSGYTLNALTIDGKELDRSATYSFLIYGDRDWYMSTVMEEMKGHTLFHILCVHIFCSPRLPQFFYGSCFYHLSQYCLYSCWAYIR